MNMILGGDVPPDFFIGEAEGVDGGIKRAMVSLGPLTSRKHCTYSCPFCYVGGDFTRYANRAPADVVRWLAARRDQFNIVYVSGDTDSFAPPRTASGLDLLARITELDTDLLFTTRYVFGEADLLQLAEIAKTQAERGKLFIGCVSALGLRRSDLEPKPIRPGLDRLRSLGRLADIGAIPVLAFRPFMRNSTHADVEGVLANLPSSVQNIVTGWLFEYEESPTSFAKPLYFDINRKRAFEYRNEDLAKFLTLESAKIGVSVFIGSAGLIDSLRLQARTYG